MREHILLSKNTFCSRKTHTHTQTHTTGKRVPQNKCVCPQNKCGCVRAMLEHTSCTHMYICTEYACIYMCMYTSTEAENKCVYVRAMLQHTSCTYGEETQKKDPKNDTTCAGYNRKRANPETEKTKQVYI